MRSSFHLKKFEVLFSQTAIRELKDFGADAELRLKEHMNLLSEDPYRPRPKVDIKKLSGGANPAIYRLRVGDYRVIYGITGSQVKVTEIIHRSKGYAWLE